MVRMGMGQNPCFHMIAVRCNETYGDSLKSDYVQMAHHGFQGLGREFYEKVDPKAAFFDAPYWLMNGESEFSSKEKEDMILDMGKTVYSYYTAPNQILLK